MTSSSLPLTRASALWPLVAQLDMLGAPTASLLERARLPTVPPDEPESLLPLHFVHRFIEHSAAWTDIPNLGCLLGHATSVYELGAFGHLLRRSVTVRDYVSLGIQTIGSVTAGERFWLTYEGGNVRVHHFQPGLPSLGRCHNDLYAISVTLNMLRAFLGPQWQPLDLHLLAPSADLVGHEALFADVALRLNEPHSSFSMPASTLDQAIPVTLRAADVVPARMMELEPPMPAGLIESLETYVAGAVVSGDLAGIDVAAEAAGTSTRTLQRHLRTGHLSYSEMVQSARMRIATEWLTATHTPIREIGAMLGYRDPAHFTRAFRAKAGISPRHYRNQAR